MDSNDVPPVTPPPVTPPPFNAPPPIMTAPASAHPRKSRGWMIVSIILIVLLVLSLFGNFTQFLGNLMPMKMSHHRYGEGPQFDETVVEDNNADDKFAVIEISGIITSGATDQGGMTMVEKVKEQLKRAREDDSVLAVVLKMDSPGGEVLASDEIFRLVREFQEPKSGKPGKPVITSMGNLAASGGYYISAASRWIVANEMTITGSIGVILHSYNYRGLMDKIGLAPNVYKSGAHKDMLSGERHPEEIPADEREMVQALIDETYTRFKAVVEEGRGEAHGKNKAEGRALVNDWRSYADGRVLSGRKAMDLGFVDEVGNFDKAVERAKKIAGVRKVNLIEYKVRYDLSDFFRMFGRSEPASIKVDLGMDLPKIEAGHLYFLSPAFLR
ncbi:MAG: signal peptide peptidase SppA [Verrucomicrobiota bacterium]